MASITVMDRYKLNLQGAWASAITRLKSARVENKPQEFEKQFPSQVRSVSCLFFIFINVITITIVVASAAVVASSSAAINCSMYFIFAFSGFCMSTIHECYNKYSIKNF